MAEPQANRGLNRVMKAQYTLAVKEDDEFVKYYMSETDVTKWYVLLSGIGGDESEFVDGQYLVRVEFTDKFPTEPPWFFFMTPNGVYNTETKVCINIGGYHKDQYRAALGARGFIKQLVSGLIGWRTLEGGINLINTSVKKKQALAADSTLYNALNNAEWMKKIDDAVSAYTIARAKALAEAQAKEQARAQVKNAADADINAILAQRRLASQNANAADSV